MKILITADPELPVPPKLYGGIERIIDLLITLISLELEIPLNRDICLTNNVFPYLSAGLSVILSCATHIALGKDLRDASMLVNLDGQDEIVIALDNFFSESDKLIHSRAVARGLGRAKYN